MDEQDDCRLERLIFIGCTFNGEPMRDFVEFGDGTVLYDDEARAFAAQVTPSMDPSDPRGA